MPEKLTRRTYLILDMMRRTQCGIFLATEAVSTTAIEHPELNMNEKATWAEWEKYYGSY